MPRENRLQVLDMIERTWSNCQLCELHKSRRRLVHWRGNPEARLAVIGSAPGSSEDQEGRPFVGRIGKLLDAVLASAGIDPAEDVFICNRVACRPPGDRSPEPGEVIACRDRIGMLMDAVKPKAILTLGKARPPGLTNLQMSIVSLLGEEPIPTIETWHPAYLEKTQDNEVRMSMIQDAKRAWMLALG